MYDFPIKYFEDNLIFDKQTKSCWAVFKVLGFNYDYLSSERQIRKLNSITRFISNIAIEAKILIIPVAQDIKEHYRILIDKLKKEDAFYEFAVSHAKGAEGYLQEKIKRDGNSNDYDVYVLTKLTGIKSNKKVLDAFIKRPVKSIGEYFSVEDRDILQSEIDSFKKASTAFFNEQDKRLKLEEVGSATIQWLIQRMFRRGLNEPPKIRKNKKSAWQPYKEIILKDGEKAVRAHGHDILSLTESTIEPGHKYIKITNSDDTVSYQTFLSMAHIPDGLIFPGSEWLLILQDYPIPTEVCIHINTIEYRESIKKISHKKQEIKAQIEHIYEHDEVPEELYESKENADALESELKVGRDPITRVSISFCIASDDAEDLATKVSFIRERYEDSNFVIERPMSDQFKLFMEFTPGAGRYVKDYILNLPPQTVASSMFPATRMLGDNEGAYIGTTGILERMVFLDMKRACQLNRSASAAFLGTLGGGKSFNANLLMYLNVLYGGKALVIDPKGERQNWGKDLSEFRDHMSITTLSAGKEDVGKLDPFLIYKNPDGTYSKNNLEEACELAQNILCELFKITSRDDEYTAILEALQVVKTKPNLCMSVLAEYLINFPEDDELCKAARMLGRKINLLKEAGMAKLLFGKGDEAGLSFNNRVNILQIQNLQMPDPQTLKDDYTQEEIVSTVLMLPIAMFAKKFALSDNSVFKVVLLDESWALSTTQMGIKLYNYLARMGRSLNAGCIFIGHSVTDLKGEGIQAAITYKFCFKSEVKEEIERVLDFLSLEKTDENKAIVKSLKNGQCLFQDLDGRVGKLQFDAVYSHLIKAFNTTPDGATFKESESKDEVPG